MSVTREYLLNLLPPHENSWVTIKDKQVVKDIIRELVEVYPETAPLYDNIGLCFEGTTIDETCDNLYDFCVNNIRYKAEGVDWQSSPVPQGVLTRGEGDCKTYAAFIGGCLGAINRLTNAGIDWAFRFVSYEQKIKTPYHVFIVVFTPSGEIWVDPTPGADIGIPRHPITKRVDNMALMREIAGVSVGADGSLAYGNAVGGSSVLNVPPEAIGLPAGYPAGTPRPFVTNGRILFTPVPPNFSPTDTQIAYMMLVLQVWVNTYSSTPYNVFAYRSHTDGSGSGIATWIVDFCELYGSSEMNHLDDPINPFATNYYASGFGGGIDNMATARKALLTQVKNFDFGKPPVPFTPSALDALMDTIAISVLRVASNLVPVIGPIYANAFIKAMGQDAVDASLLNQGVANEANKALQQAATTSTMDAETAKSKRLKIALIIAAIGLAWWWVSENE